MAETNNKKYVCIINDGTDDYEIKDVEARAGNPTYASVATCESIIDEII